MGTSNGIVIECGCVMTWNGIVTEGICVGNSNAIVMQYNCGGAWNGIVTECMWGPGMPLSWNAVVLCGELESHCHRMQLLWDVESHCHGMQLWGGGGAWNGIVTECICGGTENGIGASCSLRNMCLRVLRALVEQGPTVHLSEGIC